MAEGCTTPRKYMEIPMNLTGHQTKEADLLRDMRSRMSVLTLAMKFKADLIDNWPGLVPAFIVARHILGWRVIFFVVAHLA